MSFCYLFFITLTQSDDYLPRNFYWLGLGYLFLLIYPITPGEILPRLAALGLSIALTTAFIYLMRFTLRKTGKLDEFADVYKRQQPTRGTMQQDRARAFHLIS